MLNENIKAIRKAKGLSQEELAIKLNVVRQTVSKWENGTTLPDVATLPLLASFFDVTVDEILGYTPQISSEEIGEIYKKLARDFAKQPFEAVWQQIQALTRRYYSCHPFLFRMCVLLVNHFQLADAEPEQPSKLMVI